MKALRTGVTFRVFLGRLERYELLDTVRDTVLRHHRVALSDVYGDSKEPSAVAARIECFWQLERLSWTAEATADLFDRESESIKHALWMLRRESGLQGVLLDDDTVVRIVRAIAAKGQRTKKKVPKPPETGELPPIEEM